MCALILALIGVHEVCINSATNFQLELNSAEYRKSLGAHSTQNEESQIKWHELAHKNN